MAIETAYKRSPGDGSTLGAGDNAIGAVELKDATADVRAKVAAGSAVVIGDNALAVKDAAMGLAADAAVATDAVGTLSAKLRGLVKLTAEVLGPVLGTTTGAAVVTDAAGTIQQYLRGLVTLIAARLPASLGAKVAASSLSVTQDSDTSWGVTVEGDVTARVANAPAAPGGVEDVTDNLTHEVTVGDLVPGVTYRLVVIPWNLGVAPGAPTDFILGVWKCAAASPAGDIVDLEDGTPITSYTPELITLPVGSTKLRVHYMRHDQTAKDCKVYLSRHDA